MIYISATVLGMILLLFSNHIKERYSFLGVARSEYREHNNLLAIPFYGILLIVYILFTLIAATRYYVGTDYNTYTIHQIPQALSGGTDTGYDVEILYKALIQLGAALGSYQWIFALTHIIILLFIFLYIKDRSVNYSQSLFIFVFCTFFNFSLNGMRQSIATAIFLYSTKYISEKKIIRYYLCIAVAILFHTSAIVYLFFYPLAYLRLNKKRIIVILPILLMLSVGSKYIYKLLFALSLKLNLYSKFFGSVYDNVLNFTDMYVLFLVLNIVILLFFYFLDTNESERMSLPDGESSVEGLNTDINIQLVATVFSAISFVIPGAFRAIYMFIPIQITLLPNMLKKIERKDIRVLITVLFGIYYIFLFSYLILYHNQNETLPYQSVLFK